jgi:3-oxoacyl-[acyl-carrier protein] reductase
MLLENKISIITGGANGIGRAVVERFAGEGAKVVIWDVDDDSGIQLQDDLNNQGGKTYYQHVDVSNSQEVNDAVSAVLDKWSQIDVLVNNAGILRDGQLVKFKDGEVVKQMTDEMFELVININLKGVFNCTRAVVPSMISQKSGSIISASSIVGLDGNFGQTNYVATKAGVIGMTKVWARELGRYGIRVNAIAPGFIATEILASMPDKIIDGMIAKTPLGRMGQPEDIADAYLFLASDQASFISGTTLRVDGGIVVGT